MEENPIKEIIVFQKVHNMHSYVKYKYAFSTPFLLRQNVLNVTRRIKCFGKPTEMGQKVFRYAPLHSTTSPIPPPTFLRVLL